MGDEIRLYYGAADTSIALATGRLSELLGWLEAHDSRDRFEGVEGRT